MGSRIHWTAWFIGLVFVTGCEVKKPAEQVENPTPKPAPKLNAPKALATLDDLLKNPKDLDPVDPPVQKQSAKSAKAIAALDKLKVYISPTEWKLDLSYTTDPVQAIKLAADLDHVYELELGEKSTDAHLAACGGFKEVRKLAINFNENITDTGLAHLKSFPQLRHLSLMNVKQATAAGFSSLAGLSDLEVLNVHGNMLGEPGAKHLRELRKLKVLEAQFCALTPAAVAHFANLTELRELKLADNRELTSEALKSLAGLTKLEKLSLNTTATSDAAMPLLAGFTQLAELDLGGTEVRDAGLKHLAKLTKINQLTISDTKTTDAGLESLAGMKQLTHLNIIRTPIKGSGLKHLAGCKELTVLEVAYMPDFTGEGLHQLAGCPKLTSINLSWTGVTDAGLADIKKLTQLTNLDLPPYGHPTGFTPAFWRDPHPERFSDKGLKHIGEMTNLEWLYLSGSGLTDEGFAHLKGLKKLKTLSLGVLPNIKGPGLEYLKDVSQLEGLRLTETGVTDTTFKHVAALKQLKSLAFHPSATTAVIEQLKRMSNLETVYVPRNWDEDAMAQVKKALPKANVYKSD